MFTTPCFIRKNSKELIEKLEKLGYDYAENGAGAWFIPICQLDYLGVNLYSKGYYMGVNGVWSSDWYDCGTNEQLFLALAALRDDSSKNQWFVDKEGNLFKCFENEFFHFKFDDKVIGKIANAMETGSSPCFGEPLVPYEDTKDWHKATLQELIEHFKIGD